MARRPAPTKSVKLVLTFRLDPDLDGDLLDWLRSIPKGERVKALKRALRGNGGVGAAATTAAQEGDEEALQAAESILGAWDF